MVYSEKLLNEQIYSYSGTVYLLVKIVIIY